MTATTRHPDRGGLQVSIQLDHVRLNVSDMAASERFYKEALGLRRICSYILKTHRILQMGPGGLPPGIELWQEPGLVPEPSRTGHVAFKVDDVTALTEKARKLGYKVIRSPFVVDFETISFIADPDGHLIELNDFVGRPVEGES